MSKVITCAACKRKNRVHDQFDITGAKCGACGQPLGLNTTERPRSIDQGASTGDTPKAAERVASALGKAVGRLRTPGGLRKALYVVLVMATIAVGLAAWKPQYNPFDSGSARLRAAISDRDTFYLYNLHDYRRAPVRLETLKYAVTNAAWHRDTFRALVTVSHRGPTINNALNEFVNACFKGVNKQGAECSAIPILVWNGNINRTDEKAFMTLISFTGTADPVKRTILRDTYKEFLNYTFSFAWFEKPVAINLYRYANAKLAGMTTSFTEAEHHLAKLMAAAKPLVTAEAEAEGKRRAQEEERRRQAAQAKKQADEVAMNEAKYGALHIGEEVYTCHRHGGIMQPRYFTTCSHIVIEIIGSRYRIESLRTCQGFYPGQRTLITRGEAAKRASLLTRKDGWGRRYLVCDPKIFQ